MTVTHVLQANDPLSRTLYPLLNSYYINLKNSHETINKIQLNVQARGYCKKVGLDNRVFRYQSFFYGKDEVNQKKVESYIEDIWRQIHGYFSKADDCLVVEIIFTLDKSSKSGRCPSKEIQSFKSIINKEVKN